MYKIKSLLFTLIFSTLYTHAAGSLYNEGIQCLEKNNTKEAVIFFTQASKDGNAKAMYKLGLIYEKDNNMTKAMEWFDKAKSNGNIKAKYNLGVLSCKMKTYTHLDDFESYAKDSTKIVQYDLAVCFLQKGNKKKAIKWFKDVAKKGDVRAEYRIATLVNNNKNKIKWLKKAANKNYEEAQFELGKILFKLKKFKKAKYWLRKAKKNGSKKATVYLQRMKDLDL